MDFADTVAGMDFHRIDEPCERHKTLLLDLIAHNADAIRRNRGRSREDSEYLALCMVLDDLRHRPDGDAAYQAVLSLLQSDFRDHFSDVITYVGWSTGQLRLKPAMEKALRKRHEP